MKFILPANAIKVFAKVMLAFKGNESPISLWYTTMSSPFML